MFDKLTDYVINAATEAERRKWQDAEKANDETKPKHYSQFTVTITAGELVEPARKRAAKHRESEKEYCGKLEVAEKELREKGVSMEVYNPQSQTFQNYTCLASGNVSSLPGGMQQTFQPRVDQKLMDACKNAKDKMLEHRTKAEQYEKEARAFAFNPGFLVKLTADDIHYFRLEK